MKAKPKEGAKDELETFIEENLRHQTCRELIKFLDDVSVPWLLAELPRLDQVSSPICPVIALLVSQSLIRGLKDINVFLNLMGTFVRLL